MGLLSKSVIISMACVAGVLGVLLLFSRVVVPLLPEQEQQTETPWHPAATPVAVSSQPTLLPEQASRPIPTLPTLPPSSTQARDSIGFYSLRNARELEEVSPSAVRVIRELPWIADGISREEQYGAEALIHLSATLPATFGYLIEKPWVSTGSYQELGKALIALESIGNDDPVFVQKIVSMPFLEELDPQDVIALDSLAYLAYSDFIAFRNVITHQRLGAGIDSEEAKIVAVLGEVNEINPDLTDILLDPQQTTIEERPIDLPLAGNITLAIIRTRPGATRSMDLLESAVRGAESFIGEPFPSRYIALLFEEAVPSSFDGTNNGVHMTILPQYDVDDENYKSALANRAIAHEVAHYYWHGGEPWLAEGAAELTATYVEYLAEGSPLEPVNYPCSPASTIHYLENKGFTESDPAFACNYAVGERFFLDLYGNLGEEQFRRGFRDLYLSVKETDPFGTDAAGMEEVRTAFGDFQSKGPANSFNPVSHAAERWYEGKMTDREDHPDPRPVVAELPTINGWINRTYVSMTEGGTSVEEVPASHPGAWLWLTLQYSHDYAGPPKELNFEIVEYYEDGFPYRRDTLTIQAERRYSGGVQWISVGPGPSQEWAVGRHWVCVYHEGRKVAQVEFEVTPR